VWPVLVFPGDGDPTARSYLIERLSHVGADPLGLMQRFEVEPEGSAKRALLVALGDFPLEVVAATEREALTGKLLVLYREHPDPGLHGAIDWLLRQKWGKAKELAAIDADLVTAARGWVAARTVAAAAVPVGVPPGLVGPLLPAPAVAGKRNWFVNGEGQTYAVVRGPVDSLLGSPASEPGRIEMTEPRSRKLIARTFAIATKEMTVEQFTAEFRRNHMWTRRYSPGPDTPAVTVTWYDCAAYCNWLSMREGLPEDQWCYEPNEKGLYDEGMRIKAGHLKLTGYRLPTEAEWEYACRSGAVTSRYHGRGEELLPRYARFVKTSDDHAWPVGQLRPNEFGLFDALGNVSEWCEDPVIADATNQSVDIENAKHLSIDDRFAFLIRGGSFFAQSVNLRSAHRNGYRPSDRIFSLGFRPTRTLP
jgi:formylglycine-generating enzyme required for sulfatase activity